MRPDVRRLPRSRSWRAPLTATEPAARPPNAPTDAVSRAVASGRRAPVVRPAATDRHRRGPNRPRTTQPPGELAADPRSFRVPPPGAGSIDLRDGSPRGRLADARVLAPPGRVRTPIAPDEPGVPGGPGAPDLPGGPMVPGDSPAEAPLPRRRRRLRWKRVVAAVLLVVARDSDLLWLVRVPHLPEARADRGRRRPVARHRRRDELPHRGHRHPRRARCRDGERRGRARRRSVGHAFRHGDAAAHHRPGKPHAPDPA